MKDGVKGEEFFYGDTTNIGQNDSGSREFYFDFRFGFKKKRKEY